MSQLTGSDFHEQPAPVTDGISLYAHIPFCLSKCPYCDFNTYQGIESQFGDFLASVTGSLRRGRRRWAARR